MISAVTKPGRVYIFATFRCGDCGHTFRAYAYLVAQVCLKCGRSKNVSRVPPAVPS